MPYPIRQIKSKENIQNQELVQLLTNPKELTALVEYISQNGIDTVRFFSIKKIC